MGLLIRTLLIWLLVLAVPAQGAAATTMAFCGPDHSGAAGTHGEQMTPSGHAHPQFAAQGIRGSHDRASAHEDSVDAGRSAAPVKGVHGDKQKCSACASCCSIGAILNSVLDVPAPDLTPTTFAVVVPTVDAFAVDGPDRPPRIVLA